MLRAQRLKQKEKIVWLGVLLGLLPFVLTLVWGTFYADPTFDTLRFAQNLVAGRPLFFDAATSGYSVPLHSPFFMLVLAALARFGLSILGSSLMLGGLGWGVATFLTVLAGRALAQLALSSPTTLGLSKWPSAGLLTACLLAFHPIIFLTAGTEYGWVTAVFFFLIWLIVQPPKWATGGRASGFGLLLWLHFDLSTVVLALLLWGWLYRRSGRLPWLELVALVAAGLAVIGGTLAADLPLPWPDMPLATWLPSVQAWLHDSEFYWLYLPPLGLGLYGERKNPVVWIGLIWAGTAVFSGSLLAVTATVVFALLTISLGISWLAQWLWQTNRVRLEEEQLPLVLGGLVLLALGLAHGSTIWSGYRFRPTAQAGIEQLAASWIAANSQPDETVYASPRIAFLAERPLVPHVQNQIDPLEAGKTLAPLITNPPDYFVTFRSIGWDFVTRSQWFQQRYKSMQRYASASAVASPFEVWAYQLSPFDLGETQPLRVNSEEGADLVAYRFWPRQIAPGEAVYVSLIWRANQPITANFQSVVRVISPVTGEPFAQRDEPTPRSIPASWWEAGELIEERFVLTTTEQIAYGAYQINVSIREPNETEFGVLYQNEDSNPLDRVLLGYTAVPFTGSIPETAVPIEAQFDDQMVLQAAEVRGTIAPGELIDVDLYWQGLRPPDENYVIFVHLLNENNEQIGGDDRQPVDGRYPTAAWQAGDLIKDTRVLQIPPDLDSGTYQLNVGVYSPETFDRLPVWNSEGDEQPNRSIALPSLNLP